MISFALKNGIRVLIHHDISQKMTSICLRVSRGFDSDPVGKGGVAHLVEHLLFGAAEGRTPFEYGRFILSLGGTIDARTMGESTEFFASFPNTAFATVLEYEFERFNRAQIVSSSFQLIKKGVREEILGYRRGLFGGLPWPDASAIAYKSHPYIATGLGDSSTIESVSKDECEKFYNEHYVSNNITITIVTSLPLDFVIKTVEQIFSQLAPIYPSLKSPTTRMYDPSEIVLSREGRAGGVICVARTPSIDFDQIGAIASYVLAALFKGAQPSAAVKRDASIGFFGPFTSKGSDLLLLTSSFYSSNNFSVEKYFFRNFMQECALGRIPVENLRMARKTAQNKLMNFTSQETGSVRLLSRLFALTGHPLGIEDLHKRIEKVTVSNISKVAKSAILYGYGTARIESISDEI